MNELTIRAFDDHDAEVILSWIHDQESFRLWSSNLYPSYPPQKEDMLSMYKKNIQTGTFFPFTVYDNTERIGHFILRYPEEDRSIMRVGFVIVSDCYRGQGYGKRMIQKVICYARDVMHAKKLTLGVFAKNESAYHCYLKAGLKESRRETVTIDGQEWNQIEMVYDIAEECV